MHNTGASVAVLFEVKRIELAKRFMLFHVVKFIPLGTLFKIGIFFAFFGVGRAWAEPFTSVSEFAQGMDNLERGWLTGAQAKQMRQRLKDATLDPARHLQYVARNLSPERSIELAEQFSKYLFSSTVCNPSEPNSANLHSNVALAGLQAAFENWENPSLAPELVQARARIGRRLRQRLLYFDGREETKQSRVASVLLRKIGEPTLSWRLEPKGPRAKDLTLEDLELILPSPPNPKTWPPWVRAYESKILEGVYSPETRVLSAKLLIEHYGTRNLKDREGQAREIYRRAAESGERFYLEILPHFVPSTPSKEFFEELKSYYEKNEKTASALGKRLGQIRRLKNGEKVEKFNPIPVDERRPVGVNKPGDRRNWPNAAETMPFAEYVDKLDRAIAHNGAPIAPGFSSGMRLSVGGSQVPLTDALEESVMNRALSVFGRMLFSKEKNVQMAAVRGLTKLSLTESLPSETLDQLDRLISNERGESAFGSFAARAAHKLMISLEKRAKERCRVDLPKLVENSDG